MIVAVPVATRVANPVVEPILTIPTFEELHVGERIVPELVAMKVTEPVPRATVNVGDCPLHPVQEIVRPPLLAVPTVSTVLPLTPL